MLEKKEKDSEVIDLSYPKKNEEQLLPKQEKQKSGTPSQQTASKPILSTPTASEVKIRADKSPKTSTRNPQQQQQRFKRLVVFQKHHPYYHSMSGLKQQQKFIHQTLVKVLKRQFEPLKTSLQKKAQTSMEIDK